MFASDQTALDLALAVASFGEVRITGGYNRQRGPCASARVLTFEATAL